MLQTEHLKQRNFIFSQFWRLEIWSECQHAWILVRALFLICRLPSSRYGLSLMCVWRGGERKLPGVSSSVQFSSVTQSFLTLCDPMNRSTPGLPVHHQLLKFTQTHGHSVSDAIQPYHPLSFPSPAPNPSQHQSLFQWVNSSHEVAKVLEFQL